MTSDSSRTDELLTLIKRQEPDAKNENWFKHPFQSRARNAVALLFILAILFWAVVVPIFSESLRRGVLDWLQPSGPELTEQNDRQGSP